MNNIKTNFVVMNASNFYLHCMKHGIRGSETYELNVLKSMYMFVGYFNDNNRKF